MKNISSNIKNWKLASIVPFMFALFVLLITYLTSNLYWLLIVLVLILVGIIVILKAKVSYKLEYDIEKKHIMVSSKSDKEIIELKSIESIIEGSSFSDVPHDYTIYKMRLKKDSKFGRTIRFAVDNNTKEANQNLAILRYEVLKFNRRE